MNILSILCIIHGAESAALKGLLHKVVITETSNPVIVEAPPVFIASGFLAHSPNTSSVASLHARRHWAATEDYLAIKDECVKACGKGVDSSCVPECQVKLYGCLDYDRKTSEGAKQYQECETKVLDTYAKFSENWEATHPYTTDLLLRSKGKIGATDFDQVQDECVEACGTGVDTSCVPECQVQMYQCLDHDRKVPEGSKKYEECKKKALETYRNFAADWEATHPYLLAVGHHTSAKELHSIQDRCDADCGGNSKKSCAPRCQTAAYTCLRIDASEAASEYKTCTEGAKAKVAEAEAASLTTAPELAAVEQACTGACGLGIDASCVPECEVQMYGCEGGATQKYTECTRKVLEKYEKFASDWNTAHPYLLASRGHADAETLEEMQDSCKDACGVGVDSSCVPECQVKMYTCLDHDRKTEDGSAKYNKCSAEVLSKYEKFADDWDAAHPYLLAVHRHVTSVELLRVQDKCTDACGAGVDSSCVPECQVEMYQCLDHDRKTKDGAEKYDECEKQVVREYKEFGTTWDAAHPY